MNKNKSIIEEWLNFREEELSVSDSNDKKHMIYFDEHFENILKNVPEFNKKFVQKQLLELDNEFSDYTYYWNRKYYQNGFKDAINLIMFGSNN